MLKEVCKKKHGAFFGILIIITAGFCLLSLPVWLENLIIGKPLVGETFYEIVVLCSTAIVLSLYSRTFMVGYTYCLIDDEVVIHKIIGRREVSVAEFRLNQIVDMGKGDSMHSSTYYTRSASRFYNVHDKKNITYIVYNDGKNHMVLFTPSETMFKIISDKRIDNR
ncbi:MAG: hypothetical protein DBX47_01105 [Clostridiales bacterium]|nr:MAG: hypothetical protein DBX47_01105 [Clostridiales bacterium]